MFGIVNRMVDIDHISGLCFVVIGPSGGPGSTSRRQVLIWAMRDYISRSNDFSAVGPTPSVAVRERKSELVSRVPDWEGSNGHSLFHVELWV